MSSIEHDIVELGQTLKAQFNLLATKDLADPEAQTEIIALSTQGLQLHGVLKTALGVKGDSAEDELEKVLQAAKNRGIPNTIDLEEAIGQLKEVKKLLPQDGACSTPVAYKEAARKVLGLS
jgi:hypothetical protein